MNIIQSLQAALSALPFDPLPVAAAVVVGFIVLIERRAHVQATRRAQQSAQASSNSPRR